MQKIQFGISLEEAFKRIAENATPQQQPQQQESELTDVFGNEIRNDEHFFVINGQVVHAEALEAFAIEVLGAKVFVNKKVL